MNSGTKQRNIGCCQTSRESTPQGPNIAKGKLDGPSRWWLETRFGKNVLATSHKNNSLLINSWSALSYAQLIRWDLDWILDSHPPSQSLLTCDQHLWIHSTIVYIYIQTVTSIFIYFSAPRRSCPRGGSDTKQHILLFSRSARTLCHVIARTMAARRPRSRLLAFTIFIQFCHPRDDVQSHPGDGSLMLKVTDTQLAEDVLRQDKRN